MSIRLLASKRKFIVGTTGWTADDLDDPRIDALWERGHFEIVEGVLTRMPTAYYDPAVALSRLTRRVLQAIHVNDPQGEFTHETDLIVAGLRVPRPDAFYLSAADRAAQRSANKASGRGRRGKLPYGRIVVPPTLVIESLSLGHEDHDRITKRAWYEQMRVPNYWMLNCFERSLEGLVLDGDHYRRDAFGKNADQLSPSMLPGLTIPLAPLWEP